MVSHIHRKTISLSMLFAEFPFCVSTKADFNHKIGHLGWVTVELLIKLYSKNTVQKTNRQS